MIFKFLCLDSLSESLQNQLVSLVPTLEDVKFIIEDLNQNLTFQPLVVQPIELLLRERSSTSNNSKASYSDTTEYDDIGKPTLLLKVQNTVDGTFSYLSIDTFFNRVEILKDLFVQYLEDGDAPLKVFNLSLLSLVSCVQCTLKGGIIF